MHHLEFPHSNISEYRELSLGQMAPVFYNDLDRKDHRYKHQSPLLYQSFWECPTIENGKFCC